MTQVSLTEYRKKFEELVMRASRGEVITVTRRGRPILDLVEHREDGESAPSDHSKPVAEPEP